MPAPRSAGEIPPVLPLLWLIIGTGCSTFSTVRSASVRPGYALADQVSGSTRPGPDVTSFYNYYECHECDKPLYGFEVGITHGWNRGRHTPPRSIGVGMNGFFPYLDAYVQISGIQHEMPSDSAAE